MWKEKPTDWREAEISERLLLNYYKTRVKIEVTSRKEEGKEMKSDKEAVTKDTVETKRKKGVIKPRMPQINSC